MRRPRIVTVFGTRPEATKMAPVVLALNAAPEFDHRLVVTAQHRGLLDDALALFGLTPDLDLDLMRPAQSLDYVAGAALSGLAHAFASLEPDFVLVHGDTTTTFAASLAAFYARVPVGHVEAGLRTSTIAEPFPEEFNRRATDLLAAHYYCPTAGAAANLAAAPGLFGGAVFVTGNTALDAVRLCYAPDYAFADPQLAAFVAHAGPKLLVTAHRRENWGARLESICAGLKLALERLPAARACWCWHPNPEVRGAAERLLGGHPQVLLSPPPRFDAFVNLLARCDLALSDSGGIQEEVTQLGRYVLVLRGETERPEAVEAGYAQVIGAGAQRIADEVAAALPRCVAGDLPPRAADGHLAPSPFGDGHAAGRIVDALRWNFGLAPAPPVPPAAGRAQAGGQHGNI
jgi:UDP-N-acetylglucosamine 2-epimerase (non-hydrolysing)